MLSSTGSFGLQSLLEWDRCFYDNFTLPSNFLLCLQLNFVLKTTVGVRFKDKSRNKENQENRTHSILLTLRNKDRERVLIEAHNYFKI